MDIANPDVGQMIGTRMHASTAAPTIGTTVIIVTIPLPNGMGYPLSR
jgi:hypothetical protein